MPLPVLLNRAAGLYNGIREYRGRHRLIQLHYEYLYTQADFEAVRELLHTVAGISLDAGKRELVYARLVRRLRACRLDRFSAYLALLGSAQGKAETVHFINALTTNLTGFFRDPHQFDYLAEKVLPEAAARARSGQVYRIWSAGCSSGEEPYSIAMVAGECMPCRDRLNVQILATDLDSSVVAKAQRGHYTQERIADLSSARTRKWFRRTGSRDRCRYEVEPGLKQLVEFRRLNLMHEWPEQGPFDLIFCRHVMIYFDRSTRRKLFERYADSLVDGGYLFLGRSETVHTVTERFEPVGRSVYRKY